MVMLNWEVMSYNTGKVHFPPNFSEKRAIFFLALWAMLN